MKREKAWSNKTAWNLYKQNWKLCREIVLLRDGDVCTIPDCYTREDLQLDHCISREVKRLFFDLNNLGYLCAEHHTHKSFRKGQHIDKKVDEICRKRSGSEWWEWALSEGSKPLPEFRTVWYQEKINQELKECLDGYKNLKN